MVSNTVESTVKTLEPLRRTLVSKNECMEFPMYIYEHKFTRSTASNQSSFAIKNTDIGNAEILLMNSSSEHRRVMHAMEEVDGYGHKLGRWALRKDGRLCLARSTGAKVLLIQHYWCMPLAE